MPAGFDTAELHAPFSHQELLLRTALGLNGGVEVNPSGGALCANPIMAAGLVRFGEAAQRIIDGTSNRAVAHATSGPCLQQNLVAVLEGRFVMAGSHQNRVAIVGMGQTKHAPTRGDVSMAGLAPGGGRAAPSPTPRWPGPTSTPSSSARRPTSSRA